MDWNSIQQLVRIVAQLAAGALVNHGVITQDLATGGVGAVVSIAAIVWWVVWEGKRVEESKKVPDVGTNT